MTDLHNNDNLGESRYGSFLFAITLHFYDELHCLSDLIRAKFDHNAILLKEFLEFVNFDTVIAISLSLYGIFFFPLSIHT